MLVALLPERAGGLLSVQSLREDLEVGHQTVGRWLNYLRELYYHFELKPFSQSVPRSLKKDGKLYLWDWSELDDAGARFENLVASHLLKACHFWTDSGKGAFDLHYLRNKEKKEVDFLVTLKRKPWLTVEAKASAVALDTSFLAFAKHLGLTHHIQIVNAPNIWARTRVGTVDTLVASAADVLVHLP
jgi:predicted AAA+ superfamily ATPase